MIPQRNSTDQTSFHASMKANLTGFGLQRRSPPFLALPSPHAVAGLLCEGGYFPSQHPHAAQTLNHRADVAELTCSASKAPHPNLMKVAAALIHWSWPSAPHHGETRLCTSLPFHISFIANIARKRPELNRDKTKCWCRRTFKLHDLKVTKPALKRTSCARLCKPMGWQ